MPQRPSKLARAITVTFVVSGVAVAVIAVVAAVHDPTSDAAWVAIPLGVLLVVWGVALARLSTDETADETADDGQTENEAPSRGPLTRLSEAIALLGVYVVMRMLHRPLDSALVGVGGVLALRFVQLGIDRIVRRREARDGEPGPLTD